MLRWGKRGAPTNVPSMHATATAVPLLVVVDHLLFGQESPTVMIEQDTYTGVQWVDASIIARQCQSIACKT